MSNRFRFVLFLLLICLAASLYAWGRREAAKPEAPEEGRASVQIENRNSVHEEEAVQVSGRVRLVGSSVFPELVISNDEMQWHVTKEEEYKLIDLQHRTVTVDGLESRINLFLANGMPAGERRTLREITIIAIE